MCYRKEEETGKNQQTGKGEEEMKRQRHHAGKVM